MERYIESEEAVKRIVQMAKLLLDEAEESRDAIYRLYAKKLVGDVLDYCHRDDFPAALIYTCADLFVQRITQDRDDTKGLKRVRMDDTEFEFDTNTAASSAAGTLSDFNFSSIRGKMNLYRKVVFP